MVSETLNALGESEDKGGSLSQVKIGRKCSRGCTVRSMDLTDVEQAATCKVDDVVGGAQC